MTSNIEAIIFDFDGVFVNSLSCIHQAYNHFFEQTGRPRIELLKDFKNFITIDFAETYRKLCIITEEEKEEAKNFVQEYLNANYLEAPVFNNMISFVKTLPHKMGIASSGTEELIEKKLQKMGLLSKMESVVGRTRVKNLKPDPEPVIMCAEELQVPLDKALFIGDTYVDMRAGKTAGVKTIGVDWGFDTIQELLAEKPDGIISKPIELLNYL